MLDLKGCIVTIDAMGYDKAIVKQIAVQGEAICIGAQSHRSTLAHPVNVHWCLDIAFREDECRIPDPEAANNFAVLDHIALSLLKKDRTIKGGI